MPLDRDLAGHAARWLSRLLMIVGLAMLAGPIRTWVEASRFQAEQTRRLTAAPADTPAMPSQPPLGTPLGVLEIPRLRSSTVVVEGDDQPRLAVGIGHLPDTPLPWMSGNSALAAHRDTFFRSLRGIRVGDEVRFHAPTHGTFRYRVRETLTVDPSDLSVLQASRRPSLTLITCYPFDRIGPAPQRFVVRAELDPRFAVR